MKAWSVLAQIGLYRRGVTLALALGLPIPAFSETAPVAPAAPVIIQPANPAPSYRGQPIFSDSVFNNVGKEDSGPTTSKSPYSGAVRGMGSEADYNSVQRDEWIAKCEPQKNQSAQAFKDCFQTERKKNLELLKSNREAVERRQGLPYRNAQSVPDLGETGEPVFGGVESP